MLGVATALAALLAASAAGWLLLWFPHQRPGGSGREYLLVIRPGMQASEVTEWLATRQAVASPLAWSAYLRLRGADRQLRVGRVVIADNMTPRELLRRIATGFGTPSVRVTLPEGLNRFEIGERLEARGVGQATNFVRATENARLLRSLGLDATTAEGYLYPDTYDVKIDASPTSLVRLLVENWRRRLMPVVEKHAVGLAQRKRELGFSLRDVLTLASIVEQEAHVRDEQPVIARVFLNRLTFPDFSPRRLQADPTVAYGCTVLRNGTAGCARFDGHRVTPEMTRDPSNPYNTYRIEGLPPGPICNPGLPAIEAVLKPAAHDYLYFVATGNGRHTFTKNLAAHTRAIPSRGH